MSLKEQLENNVLVIIAGAIIATASIVWVASEKIQVGPRDREIAFLKQQVTNLTQNLHELNAVHDPYRKQMDQLVADKQQLENARVVCQDSLKQWQDTLETWKTQNSELQKQLNLYVTNCSIISEIRALDARKSSIENTVSSPDLLERVGIEERKRQANELQARILDLQQRLACQPR